MNLTLILVSYIILSLIVVFSIHLYVIKIKKEELFESPLIMVIFLCISNIFNYKYWPMIIFSILFFPFVNLYIFYTNFLRNHKFLCNKHFIDYNLNFSKETISELSSILIKNNLEFKEKYLNDNLKHALIMSLRKYVIYLETKDINLNTELFFQHLNYFLETGKFIDFSSLISYIEKDYKEYLKKYPNEDTVYDSDNNKIFVFNDKLFQEKSFIKPIFNKNIVRETYF